MMEGYVCSLVVLNTVTVMRKCVDSIQADAFWYRLSTWHVAKTLHPHKQWNCPPAFVTNHALNYEVTWPWHLRNHSVYEPLTMTSPLFNDILQGNVQGPTIFQLHNILSCRGDLIVENHLIGRNYVVLSIQLFACYSYYLFLA